MEPRALSRAAVASPLRPAPLPGVAAGPSASIARDARARGDARRASASAVAAMAGGASGGGLRGLVFDCDGVIVESEDLHRRAYNAAFEAFEVVLEGGSGPVVWDEAFYDDLQNRVGGGKPKMRWFFGREGWPSSTVMSAIPASDEDRAALVDALQDFKSEQYRALIGSGDVSPRPGVLRLMDEARDAGLAVAVCSAATKESVIFTLRSLLGDARFEGLDCFLAGDDVRNKKPHPEIYEVACARLGIPPEGLLVIEDSAIGLQAALGAGMRCLITTTSSTKGQDFDGAEFLVPSLDAQPAITLERLQAQMAAA